MIYTLTLNPSLDYAIRMDHFTWGVRNRTSAEEIRPGGKGINISVVLTNLGSIKLHSGYHHLTNWGTNSLFVIVGERKKRPFWKEDGSFDMKDSIDLGLTVDERIADGYYFSKSVKLLIKLLEDPELLEKPLSEEVEY